MTRTSDAPTWLELWRTAIIMAGVVHASMILKLGAIRYKRKERVPNQIGQWGTISWVAAISFMIFEIASKYGEPLTWRSPLATAVLATGIPALYGVQKIRWR